MQPVDFSLRGLLLLPSTGSVVVAHGLSCSKARGIFLPGPGIKTVSPALAGRFLTTGSLREVLSCLFYTPPDTMCFFSVDSPFSFPLPDCQPLHSHPSLPSAPLPSPTLLCGPIHSELLCFVLPVLSSHQHPREPYT